jgi:hypothetical protein
LATFKATTLLHILIYIVELIFVAEYVQKKENLLCNKKTWPRKIKTGKRKFVRFFFRKDIYTRTIKINIKNLLWSSPFDMFLVDNWKWGKENDFKIIFNIKSFLSLYGKGVEKVLKSLPWKINEIHKNKTSHEGSSNFFFRFCRPFFIVSLRKSFQQLLT